MPLIRRASEPPSPDGAATGAGLRSGSADERWAAARALAGDAGAVPRLAEALSVETAPRVRAAIFTSLAVTGTGGSVDAVLPHLRSDEAELRTGALDALRAMPAAMAARLPALLADADADVRLLACDLARELPPDEATPLLADLLDHESETNVCAAAVEVLAERGTPDALPSLRRCAERFAGEAFLRFAIEIATRRIGSDRIAK